MKKTLSAIFLVCATASASANAGFVARAAEGVGQAPASNVADLKLKARTNRENPIDYEVGEDIRFDVFLDGVGELPPELATNAPLYMKWTRQGDDGRKIYGMDEISLTNGFSVTTSLAIPGMVRLFGSLGTLVGSDFREFEYYDGNGDKKNIKFEGGAGVATERMQLTTVEPADFDQFWAEAKAKLAAVPFDDEGVELVEVFPASSATNTYCFYAAKIPCFGPRHVTGWLIIPRNAQPGTLAAKASFDSYSATIKKPSPPTTGPGTNMMLFRVNAHGYDMVGHDQQYYTDFANEINVTNRPIDPSDGQPYTYGLAPSDYDNPSDTYFYYLALRIVRAFDYLKSRPEWNGTDLVAEGSSQGGLQTMWAGGLVDGISEIRPSITWGCDVGCPFNGKGTYPSRPWGIPNVPGAFYFDAALHAKRVPVTCIATIQNIRLGDYTSPPRGVLLSYYNMKCQTSATIVQGSTHTYVAPQPNQTFEISKEAVGIGVSDAEGQSLRSRVITVTGLPPGEEVSVALTAPDGTARGATATATADRQGVAVAVVATKPGVNYCYRVARGGEEIGTGAFFTGDWNADGTWFLTAPDGQGGAIEVNGAWTTPPAETNATAFASDEEDMAFTLSANAIAEGSEKFVRTDAVVTYRRLDRSIPPPPGDSLTNSLAAVAAVTNAASGGPSTWMACVNGAWRALSGEVPVPNVTYTIRMESDFTSPSPRVRLSVSDNGGAAFATLADAETGAEWLVPTDSSKRALGEIAACGAIEVNALHGELSNGANDDFYGTMLIFN